MPPPKKTHIDVIIGVLRLAHKYDVHFLRSRALEHLGTMYVTRLEDYWNRSTASYKTGSLLDAHLKTIQVSAEVGASWLLPDAYYNMICFGLQAVLNAGDSWNFLGESEKEKCLRVFSHKAQLQPSVTILSFLSISKGGGSHCKNWTVCNKARLDTIQDHAWGVGESDVLEAWDGDHWCMLKRKGLCELCLKEAKEIHGDELRLFWNKLPNMFDLPNWSTLEEMRKTAVA
jgi:hypothetical protein